MAAPPNRITKAVDASRTTSLGGHIHPLAQPSADRGAVDPSKHLDYMLLLVKPSAAQQADLETLLINQQNPASPNFHQWLTPEQFGSRFGLNSSDQSKVVSWLTSQGLTVDHLARSGNWIAFSGSAAQVSTALHTPIHQFQVKGKTHFANTAVPSVPEALAGVVQGFMGLDDFHPVSNAIQTTPDYTSGANHYLAPLDFATIYDVAPLYSAGIDGTGQSIVVVGQSDILTSDITTFRSRFGLPVNAPKLMLYGSDPGFNGAEGEGNLDIEWAGAVAPKATIYYVYGQDAFEAAFVAVESNYAPVISISYSSCESNVDPQGFRALGQQANAQGITMLAASGDAGAAGCDGQGGAPFATLGKLVNYPAAIPEVTAVGGTQFAEAGGSYWTTNAPTTFNSALSYIPEAAWNESGGNGLLSTGGGASIYFQKPAWQSAPGVPTANSRYVPDVSLSAALHDSYLVEYLGGLYSFGGTSCGTPSMAGIVALMNQYQVSKGFQTKAGLGNINPQLYHLAQSSPTAFHDTTTGNNIVQCAQGSPDCSTGSFGYSAGAGYDLATGLGSVDANVLVTQWNTAANGTQLTLSLSATKATLNDTVQATATVTASTGSGTPTGTVTFIFEGSPLATATLVNGAATVSIPLYTIGYTGAVPITADYSGDASFSPSGATKSITVTVPATGATSIVPSGATSVYAQLPDAQGVSWQTSITLFEIAGVPAIVTGLTIDGAAQTLSQYFPSTAIEPKGSLTANFVFRGLSAPVTKTFVFTGTDPTGATWTRQIAVNFLPLATIENFNFYATPLTVTQNPANAACPFSVQLNLEETGGFGGHIVTSLFAGGIDISSKIVSTFGTTHLEAYGALTGTVCFSNITPPATNQIGIVLDSAYEYILNVNFAAPPASPGTLSVSPAAVTVVNAATLSIALSDQTQAWTAAVYPGNRTTSWLHVSPLSGTGSTTLSLVANPAGFEPGVYRATIVFQSANAVPQVLNVPVTFVVGGASTSTTISAVANAASYKTAVAPGMLLGVFGANLANATATATTNPLPYSLAGVSATVNGIAAPIVYASPGFVDIQVPYATGSGPATLGLNNNGQIAAFQFQVTPSAPGIFADANGNLVPTASVTQGTALALYITGAGDVTPSISTAYAPSASTPVADLPAPIQPLSVTIGGVQAFLEFVGITPGLIGVTQVNILVPASTPTGNQTLIVTVGGVSSAAVNVVVQPK